MKLRDEICHQTPTREGENAPTLPVMAQEGYYEPWRVEARNHAIVTGIDKESSLDYPAYLDQFDSIRNQTCVVNLAMVKLGMGVSHGTRQYVPQAGFQLVHGEDRDGVAGGVRGGDGEGTQSLVRDCGVVAAWVRSTVSRQGEEDGRGAGCAGGDAG